MQDLLWIILERIPFIYGSDVFIPLSFLTNENFNDFLNSYTYFDREKSILFIKTQKFLQKNNISPETLKQNIEQNNKNISKKNIKKNSIANLDFDNDVNYKQNFDLISEITKNNLENSIKAEETIQPINTIYNLKENTEENIITNLKNTTDKINISTSDKKINNGINKIHTIILDPGHGGKDPGATYHGINEKNITLDITTKIKNILEKEYKKSVFLTRESDIFISLEDRVKKANDLKGDIFLSIHINAAPNKKDKNGFEIYYLSEKVSDKEAEKVAKRENVFLDMNTTNVNQILWSMKLNEYTNQSSKLSHFVDKNINSDLQEMNNNGIKRAGFFVLKGVKMPSILLEIGYLSNKKELSNILNQKFQEDLAKIIAKSIIEYENEP